jgi:hypothetical protein
MPMNPRLLRPRSTIHPEAADWARRVRANGGSVSGSTLNAVSRFCASIAAAGIRDRFYRLNLFCGTGLPACLVPLYRGPSLGGTQFGNATDANNGPFVGGDYAETGASGGLAGNGTSKYLDTGFSMDTLPSTVSGHASVYCPNRSARSAFAGMIGVAVTVAPGFGISTDDRVYGIWGAIASVINSTNGMLVVSRESGSLLTTYANATSIATNTSTVTPAAQARNAAVFANRATPTTVDNFDSRRYCGYSIGLGMTAPQVSAYYTAIQAFQAALSRNV